MNPITPVVGQTCDAAYKTLGGTAYRCDAEAHPKAPRHHYFVRDAAKDTSRG